MEGSSENDALLDTVSREDVISGDNEIVQVSYKWQVFRASMNAIVHTLMAGGVFVTLWFTWSLNPGPYQQHIILCVIGYQLLMSHGILILSDSTWGSIPITYKRRIHWILQLVGAALSIAGSVVMMKQKGFKFNSLHGKFGLAALIFSCISLINGATSLYAVELRRFIPPKLSKISHIILGTAAFILSSACLALGYNKNGFKEVISKEFSLVMNIILCVYTVSIVAAPCFKLLRRVF